jgi:uncharacterized cupin superfamily protein
LRPVGIAHRDEVDAHRLEKGEMAALWQRLGDAAGTVDVGLSRVRIDPGRLSTPPHSHSVSEEIVYVLGGGGLSWQDEAVHELRPGDCVVHVADHEEHTLRAGPEGLDVLIFGTRARAELGWLPRSRAVRLGWPWVEGRDDDPWDVEATLGPLAFGEPAPRPPTIVNVDECPDDPEEIRSKALAEVAGSVRAGLNWLELKPGEHSSAPHCHSAEEEVFVVLEGAGTLELWPSPRAAERGARREDVPVRAGHVVARPPGTRVGHRFTAGPDGMTMLAYGTCEPNDIAYYPRSNAIFFRCVGVIGRLAPLRYGDGEDD